MLYSDLFRKKILIIGVTVWLTACGGGGGSDGNGSNDNTVNEPQIDENADTDGDGLVNLTDVDDDNDGLIEIKTLEQLDWMRNDLRGNSLTDNASNVMTDGCPAAGCTGYELAYSLDFDTNGDGVMNASDDYFDYHKNGTNSGWLPVGNIANSFQATFDGNSRNIRNLYINRDSTDPFTGGEYIGLFGVLNAFGIPGPVEIRNVELNGSLTQVTGRQYVGLLSGAAFLFYNVKDSTARGMVTASAFGSVGLLIGRIVNISVSNSASSGTVNSNANASGGLIGAAGESRISDSTSSATVNGRSAVGGLVGSAVNTVILERNSASGNVVGRDQVGGLVGRAGLDITIDRNVASGHVSIDPGGESAGGLVGMILGPNDGVVFLPGTFSVTNSYATGNVTGDDFTGGLIGSVNFDNPSLYGCSTPCGISRSFATGMVEGNNYVGGLIGISYNVDVEDSFATGEVRNSNQYVGGLIGDANSGTDVDRSFASNPVSGNLDVGALVGFSASVDYADSYFSNNRGQANALGTNFTSAGDINPVGTTGAPLSELQTATTAGQNVNGQNLFSNWGVEWDLGNSSQLPGLVIDGIVYRDGNANGQLD